jgi:hypothetical protein
MDAERVLAFRLARSGLAARQAPDLADAAATPASDFARDAALLALGARTDNISREAYAAAVDAGDVVVAYVVRGAINAVAPDDWALWGRALVARDDDELAAQLGRGFRDHAAEHGWSPAAALAEVAAATTDALSGGTRLDKNALHEALRERLGPELLPWCPGCESHHVSPMLWRYATVAAGARLDAARRYMLGRPGRPPAAREAVRRFLATYGPATPADFAEWAGLAPAHARRLWREVEGDLAEVEGPAWLLAGDVGELESPPAAHGVRLLPPGDPYLQKINRPLLAPDTALRARLFRPVGSPGAVLLDGRLAGLWRARGKGKRAEVAVEAFERLPPGPLEEEAGRVSALRGAAGAAVRVES